MILDQFSVAAPYSAPTHGKSDPMAIDALVAPLLKIALFQGLRPLQITEIARRAERIVFKPGQVIMEADRAGDAAFVIVSGNAARTKGPDVGPSPEPIAAGSLIGEMAMLVETEHSSTIVATSPVRALKITRSAMYEQMADDAALAEHLVAKITARLQSLATELRKIDQSLAPDDGSAVQDDPGPPHQYHPPLALESVRPGLETRH
jgi:CRP-like cAMP-binding protein